MDGHCGPLSSSSTFIAAAAAAAAAVALDPCALAAACLQIVFPLGTAADVD